MWEDIQVQFFNHYSNKRVHSWHRLSLTLVHQRWIDRIDCHIGVILSTIWWGYRDLIGFSCGIMWDITSSFMVAPSSSTHPMALKLVIWTSSPGRGSLPLNQGGICSSSYSPLELEATETPFGSLKLTNLLGEVRLYHGHPPFTWI